MERPAELRLRRARRSQVPDDVGVGVPEAGNQEVEDDVVGDTAAIRVDAAGRHPAVLLSPVPGEDLEGEIGRLGLLVLLPPALLLALLAALELLELAAGELVAQV